MDEKKNENVIDEQAVGTSEVQEQSSVSDPEREEMQESIAELKKEVAQLQKKLKETADERNKFERWWHEDYKAHQNCKSALKKVLDRYDMKASEFAELVFG